MSINLLEKLEINAKMIPFSTKKMKEGVLSMTEVDCENGKRVLHENRRAFFGR